MDETRLAALVTACHALAGVGALLYDFSARTILDINAHGAALYGRTREEMIGTSYEDYACELARTISDARAAARSAGEKDPGYQGARTRIRRADGASRLFEWTMGVDGSGGPIGLALFRDVTGEARPSDPPAEATPPLRT